MFSYPDDSEISPQEDSPDFLSLILLFSTSALLPVFLYVSAYL
jgi:hypothetical protein